jgi:hypothetical protein
MAKYIEDTEIEEVEIEEEEDRGDDFEGDEDEIESTEDDVESEEEEDEEEEEVPTKNEPRIPKSRLDEVIQQREDAKERNLWLENQLEKLINASNKSQESTRTPEVEASTYDFDRAEEDYISLIIEGEIGKATKLRNTINKERQSEMMNLIKGIESSVTSKAKTDSSAVIEQDRFDNYVDTIEAKYPFLDSKNKSYNEEAVETVNTLLAGYIAAGKTKTEGLKLAVGKVAPFYSKDEVEAKKSLGNKRTVEAGKKAAKAAASQPTKVKSGSSRSADASSINISKMSERDFSKLTAREKSILRGD